MNLNAGCFVNLFPGREEQCALDVTEYRRRNPAINHFEILCESLLTDTQKETLQVALRDCTRAMHAPYVGVSLASPDDGLRKASIRRVSDAIELALELGCSSVTIHAGAVGVWQDSADTTSYLIDSLTKLAEYSIPIALENMPRRSGGTNEPVTSCQSLASVLDQLPGIAATLDIGHCLQNHDDPLMFIGEYSNRIVNIHLHDAKIGGQGHLTLGAGDLDIAKFRRCLIDSDYRGAISLETIGMTDTLESWKLWTNQA